MAVIRDMMPVFELFQPANVTDALALLDRHGSDAWILAGGLDTFDWLKDRSKRTNVVIDLSQVNELRGIKEVDGGLETLKVKLPAVITTDLRLCEPRYASLPNIMKAKKKPIADKSAADYSVDLTPHLEVLKTSEPPGRKGGVKVKDVAELISKLKTEAGVL